jgi:hydrogenase maturation protein HypF
VLDPGDRRAGYPFTTCTHCGPRFSIIRSLPYDRPRTTMAGFEMCPACQTEYDSPGDRRFHAQPNACPNCGPALALWEAGGRKRERGAGALEGAAAALESGAILAVKGLGGFHLMVDAGRGDALLRLREAKPRREKPFALMVRDLAQAASLCALDAEARAALASPQAPILLLPRQPAAPVHERVAPGSPYLGVMLAHTPLHHLLLQRVGVPLVATSGNLSDEPICTDEREAVRRLAGIADLFLVHDRPIARHVDDSIAWHVEGATRLLRRARGFAPRPVVFGSKLPTLLAVGGHLKSTVALAVGRRVFVSQHVGDLDTPQALEAFERVIADLLRLYEAAPVAVAHDLHPDYASTRWVRQALEAASESAGGPLSRGPSGTARAVPVQHHHAHFAACLADNGWRGRALGVTWDGTGYGYDGTVWGGEFLLGDAAHATRVAHLRPFRLPGGEQAIREPRRAALALLHALEGEKTLERDDLAPVRAFGSRERALLARMLERGLNSPLATSAGRLFDAVAALVGPWQVTSFEGQAALGLESLADRGVRDAYPLELTPPCPAAQDMDGAPQVLDWRPLLEAVMDEVRRGVGAGAVAARFHNALAEGIARVAEAVGEPVVALSGGCFQNRLLVERAAARLRAAGFRVLLHRQVPPNDGGISLGQVAVAAAALERQGD